MKKLVAVVLLFAILVMTGCMTHVHVIGAGAKGGTMEQARQWYILWGLVPLNNVDTRTMAAGAKDYTIKTEISPMDFLLNIFTSWVTVYSRTVAVTR
ncbi:MAG: Bor/Iss family lipoprotein [Bacteroidota bacterium]